MGPNIIQQEKQMEAISDEALQQLLRQMAQTNQVGTPGFILAAGELQGRKEARQQAMMGQGNPRPVIADLLMGDAMPPQMPVLPENAGGIAALPAPNMEGIATLAGGGLVAFSNGGDVKRRFEALPRYVGQEAGVPGAELTNFFKSRMRGDARIDPVTGQPVTFGEFVRLEDQRAAAAARTPAIEAIPAGTAAPAPGLITAQQPSDQSFLSGLLTAASPGIAAPAAPPPPIDRADAMKQARVADNTGLAAIGQKAPAAGNQPTVTRVDTPPAAGTAGVGAAPSAPPTIDYKDAFEKAGATAKELLGTAPTMPAEVTTKSVKEAVEADRKLFEELGIADPTKLRREQIEAEMKEAKSDKAKAGWAALLQFGANWASQNGSALQAAANAGVTVAPGLLSDLKDLQKTERAQKRELAGLAALDAQAQRDMTAKARDRLDTQRENALRRVDEHRKNIATLSASIGANAISSQTQLTTTGMTTAASRDVARISADATLAKLAEQMAETETKNIVDAAKDLLVRRQDYVLLAQDPAAMDKAFKDAIRSVKQGRALAATTVTKSGT
jgi:hypothetical protein